MPQTTTPSPRTTAEVVHAPTDQDDQPADREAEGGADERRPQVDVRIGEAIEPQVPQHRLGDQAESLRAARQRGDHQERRDADFYSPSTPALFNPARGAEQCITPYRKNVLVPPVFRVPLLQPRGELRVMPLFADLRRHSWRCS